MEDVVSGICCGVDETEVLKYRVKDVAPHLSNKSELKKEAVEEEKWTKTYKKYIENTT